MVRIVGSRRGLVELDKLMRWFSSNVLGPLRSVTTGVRQVPQPDRVRRRSVRPRFGLLARSQNLSEVIWSGGQIGDHGTDLEQTATRKRCSRLTCADAQPSGGNEGSRLFHLLCGAFRRQATSVAPSNEGSRETGGQGVAGSNPVSPTYESPGR